MNTLSKVRIAAGAAALALAASALSVPAEAAGVKAGVLTCRVTLQA
jgi:hypothetical protein